MKNTKHPGEADKIEKGDIATKEKDIKEFIEKEIKEKREQREQRDQKMVIEPLTAEKEEKKAPGDIDKPVKKNVFQPNSKYFTIVMYGLLFVLCAILIYKFIGNFGTTLSVAKYLVGLISPFLIGIFIALVLFPIVHFFYHKFFMNVLHMKSKKLAKWLSILAAYVIGVGAFVVLMVFVIPQIYNSISDIVEEAPVLYQKIYDWIGAYESRHPNSIISYEFLNDKLQSAFPQIIEYLTGILGNLVPYILTTSVAIVKGVINLIIAIMVSVYMIADHKNIFFHFKRFVYAVVPKNNAENVRIICKNCANIFINFILGKALDSLIIGIITFIAMVIFKMPFAVLISVIVGVTNMIPYFGPYIGGVIGGIIIVMINPVQVLVYAIMILVIQQFDGLFLGPKILGSSTGLRPLWVIFAITMGGYLFGVLGMFLGVPVFAVITYLIDITIKHFLDKKEIQVEKYDSEDEM